MRVYLTLSLENYAVSSNQFYIHFLCVLIKTNHRDVIFVFNSQQLRISNSSMNKYRHIAKNKKKTR